MAKHCDQTSMRSAVLVVLCRELSDRGIAPIGNGIAFAEMEVGLFLLMRC